MKMVLSNKIDFALVFTVKNANPNGDPLGGNRPRTTSEELGEVSDVCLKRKMRNRLMTEGEEIFVQSDENVTDGKKSLSERFNDFLKALPSAVAKEKTQVANLACEKWIDVRSFGQVFAFKKQDDVDAVSLGVRGPVTIQSAFSLEPVIIESIQITKSVNSETTQDGKKDESTMGMKHRVSNAIYVTYGSISPQLAEKTGFANEDAEKIKHVLATLFNDDESSARPSGSIAVKQLVWWKHNNKAGQYSSAKVHGSLKIDNNGNISFDSLEGLSPQVING